VDNDLLRRKVNEDKTKLNQIVTTLVTDMGYCSSNYPKLNEDISTWDTYKVTDMYQMFIGVFKQDLSQWTVEAVTDCSNFSKFTNQSKNQLPNFTKCTPKFSAFWIGH